MGHLEREEARRVDERNVAQVKDDAFGAAYEGACVQPCALEAGHDGRHACEQHPE